MAVELSKILAEEKRDFMRQGQSLNLCDVTGEADGDDPLMPPLVEETPEDLRRELEHDEKGPDSPDVSATLGDAGLNDYVDRDVDFEPTPNPANANRPDSVTRPLDIL